MAEAYIGIGGNIGNVKQTIARALELLHSPPAVKVLKTAPLYRTAPVGYQNQDWFLNTAAKVETELNAHQLLNKMQQIEESLMRRRTIRWGPRTIDLDLLIFDDLEINTPELTLPHPRMTERAFVMVPLADINPTLKMPGGKTAAELAGELKKVQEIYKLETK
ncbi:MAG: 2-amino-4-hydroxy-6-hydroxymethyldihydropteridine diphosphokinase [Desulfotomaculum sp.]|nr:2-amino-4-hydroxy-6-hydroxymethyldihydropteridine diphosphokinase [Desulfotomaculum sp.]